MIDHLSIAVSDYPRSRDFYQKVLATLNYGLVMEFGNNAGFGPPEKSGFWITENQETSPQGHVCFQAKTRAAVRSFYEAAMAEGAKSDFPPGIVEEYHPSYYAAFVFDPDGYKIEALCLHDE